MGVSWEEAPRARAGGPAHLGPQWTAPPGASPWPGPAGQPQAQGEAGPPPIPQMTGAPTAPVTPVSGVSGTLSQSLSTGARCLFFILPSRPQPALRLSCSECRRKPGSVGQGSPGPGCHFCGPHPCHILLSPRRPMVALKGGPRLLGLTVQPEVERCHGLFPGWEWPQEEGGGRAGDASPAQRKGCPG